jgi:hypothetical protein
MAGGTSTTVRFTMILGGLDTLVDISDPASPVPGIRLLFDSASVFRLR